MAHTHPEGNALHQRVIRRTANGGRVASVCCVCVRARQREEVGRESEGTQARGVSRSRREACEKGSGREAAEMKWMMDESSTLMHER